MKKILDLKEIKRCINRYKRIKKEIDKSTYKLNEIRVDSGYYLPTINRYLIGEFYSREECEFLFKNIGIKSYYIGNKKYFIKD